MAEQGSEHDLRIHHGTTATHADPGLQTNDVGPRILGRSAHLADLATPM